MACYDQDTYIYIYIDPTASMDDDRANVATALIDLKAQLEADVYGDLIDERVFIVNPPNDAEGERWLRFAATPTEDKVIVVALFNEADPIDGSVAYYHDLTAGIDEQPTADYDEDYALWQAQVQSKALRKGILYAIEPDAASEWHDNYVAFREHAVAAMVGSGDYEPLSELGFTARLDVPSGETADYYLEDILARLRTICADLDSPLRVALTESVRGQSAEVGIQLDYLPNDSIIRDVGELAVIDDPFNPGEVLYHYWVRTLTRRDGIISYTGETILGRLDNVYPGTLVLRGPFTARQMLELMLARWKYPESEEEEPLAWLEWEPIPELMLQTTEGLLTPVSPALALVQGDRTKAENLTSALEWLDQILRVFDGYVRRVNQEGKLEVVAPPWAAAVSSLYFPPGEEEILQLQAGDSMSWGWGASALVFALWLGFEDPDGLNSEEKYYSGTLSLGQSFEGQHTFLDAKLNVNLSEDGLLTITADNITPGYGGSFTLRGRVFSSEVAVPAAKVLLARDLKYTETRTTDIDYVYWKAKTTSRGGAFVEDSEAWEPAYADFEPELYWPDEDAWGREFPSAGERITVVGGDPLERWLPEVDPETYGRKKVVSAWQLPEETLLELGTDIQLDVGIDFFWSYAEGGYDNPQIEPVQYPGGNGVTGFTYRLPGEDWNDDPNAPPAETIPYQWPTLALPADGQELLLRWRVQRSPLFTEGVCEMTLGLSYDADSRSIVLREVKKVLVMRYGGGSPGHNAWCIAPRFTLNASGTVFQERESVEIGIWGEDEHLSLLPTLGAARASYPDRPMAQLDTGPFAFSAATCVAISEHFVRRRHLPTELISLELTPPHNLRPDDVGRLIELPTLERAVLLERIYGEQNAPREVLTNLEVRLRKDTAFEAGELEEAFPDEVSSLVDLATTDLGVVDGAEVTGGSGGGGGGGGSGVVTGIYPSEYDIIMGNVSNPFPSDSYYPTTRPFVSAQGYGATATGWRTSGMRLGLVTSRGMSSTVTNHGGGVYSGTLEGLLQHPDPMYIIPLVAGYIDYTSGHPFYEYGNKFFAGQFTLPGTKGLALRYTPSTTPSSFDILMNWDDVNDVVIRYLKLYRGVSDAADSPDTTGISVSGTAERYVFDNLVVALIAGDDPITFFGAPKNLSVQHTWSVFNMRGTSFARGFQVGGGATRVFADWMFILASGGRNPRLLGTGVFSHFLNHSRAGFELLSDADSVIYPHLINGRKRNTEYNDFSLIGLAGKIDSSHPAPELWIENFDGYKFDGTQYRSASPADFWEAITRNHQNKGEAQQAASRLAGLPAWLETSDLDTVEHVATRKTGGMWALNPLTGAMLDRRDDLQLEAQQYGFDLNVDGDEGGNSDWNTGPYQWPTLPTGSLSVGDFFDHWLIPWIDANHPGLAWDDSVSTPNGTFKVIELFAAACVPAFTEIDFDASGNPIEP